MPFPSMNGPGWATPLLALGLLLAPVGRAQTTAVAPDDERTSRVDYTIEARLDGETKILEGRETLVWENRTTAPATDLWFHLYLNAFSNNRSTHLTEGKGKVKSGRTFERGWGWQRVTSIRVRGEERVGAIEFVQPDEGLSEDRTVFRLPLLTSVEPGASLEVELEWTSQLPRVQRRTGYKDRFLLVAQWFPKLGVFEGEDGWNCHQFHFNSEFYADFGHYDVTLDLPEAYAGKVGATGVQAGEAEVADGRVRTRFLAPSPEDRERVDWTGRAPRVHDFAWTADPDYLVREGTFEFDAWAARHPEEVEEMEAVLATVPAGSLGELSTRDVRVRVLIHPEREGQWTRHFEATCAALFFYGLWYGEYPYEQVTVVDPAWGARAAGGMEYPTLFTCGTRLFTAPPMHQPESVTVHEAGHQFWYGLVGNNEFENPWLDEGFNSYTDAEVDFRHYGTSRAATWYARLPVWGRRATSRPGGPAWADWISLRELPLGPVNARPLGASGFLDWWRDQPLLTLADDFTDPRWSDRCGYLRSPEWDPVATRAWEFVDRRSYGTNTYSRPAAALRTLAGLVGREPFLRGMRSFAKEGRYRHPYPEDFFAAFQEGAGVDVGWYLEEVFLGTERVDWSVSVEQRREPKPKGLFQGTDGLFARIDDGAESDEAESEEENDEDVARLFDVVVRREGDLRLPLPILVQFDAGSEERLVWTREQQAEAKWWKLPLAPAPKKIQAVILDPERVYYLDGDMSDNQWYAESDPVPSWRWGERVLVQYQHLLHAFAATGG